MSAFASRGLLIVVSLVWGLSYVIIASVVDRVAPFSFNFLRFGSASALFAFGWLIWRRQSASEHPRRKSVITGCALGFFLFAAFSTQTFGFQTTSATNAAFLTGLGLVFVPVINKLAFKTDIAVNHVIAILLSMIGLCLFTGIVENGISNLNRGDLLILLSAMFFAVHIVLTGSLVKDQNSCDLTLWQIIVMAVLSFLCQSVFEQKTLIAQIEALDANSLSIIAFTAIFSTCFGYLAQTHLQQSIPATQVALILALEPVFAGILDFGINGVQLSLIKVVGALLILLSVLVSELGIGLVTE